HEGHRRSGADRLLRQAHAGETRRSEGGNRGFRETGAGSPVCGDCIRSLVIEGTIASLGFLTPKPIRSHDRFTGGLRVWCLAPDKQRGCQNEVASLPRLAKSFVAVSSQSDGSCVRKKSGFPVCQVF